MARRRRCSPFWLAIRATSRSCTDPRRLERGQTTVEFALALLIIVAGIAGFYQALHFELDVFNRMLRLRQEALHKAHEEQETTPRTLFRTSMDFRPLSEVTPVPVPFQSTDLSLRYPTKNFTMEHGAMYRDQFSAIHDKWAIDVMLLTAHYEDSRAAFQIPFNAADAIPVPVPFWVRPTFFMTDLEYGFVDPP